MNEHEKLKVRNRKHFCSEIYRNVSYYKEEPFYSLNIHFVENGCEDLILHQQLLNDYFENITFL